jgi:hypothetical protein
VAALCLPGLQFVFFHQSLNGAHRQAQQFGCVGGATVIFGRVGSGMCLHVFILVIKVPNDLKGILFYVY